MAAVFSDLVSRPQDTGHKCRVVSKARMFIDIINRWRISRQSKQRGCETPNALSSITMVEKGATIEIINKNSLHARSKTKQAMNDGK